MTRDEAVKQITKHPEQYLTPDLSKKGYVCPICGSGTGKNGTGITTKDGVHFSCWAGCFTHSDILDIIGKKYGLADFDSKLKKACEIYSIDYDSLKPNECIKNTQPTKTNQTAKTAAAKTDNMRYYKECAKNRIKTDYLTKRGISEEVQDRFMIGYDDAIKKIIIPTSRYSYVERDVRPDTEKENRYRKKGTTSLFNKKALENISAPVFIVEGEIDAMSFEQIGFHAIALGSTSNANLLIDHVKANKPTQPLIIALDNDDSGMTKAAEIYEELKKQGIECSRADNIYSKYKDANERLIKDRKGLEKDALKAVANVRLLNDSYYLKAFLQGIEEEANTRCIPTGFEKLDKILGGGLFEGLYVIGAISSLGKTTLSLQIASNIADQGHDVLIFSLEMARNELIAKHISRITAEIDLGENKTAFNAKTTREITRRTLYRGYNETELDLIKRAEGQYEDIGKHIITVEGMGDIGVNEIREKIKRFVDEGNDPPVVIIDYLQILAPYNIRYTDKQNIDKNVMELKRISRDFKMTVIVISSFNRDNYDTTVSMKAFKESGAIEYSSDVLIGLQLKGVGENNFNIDTAKQKDPREIEVKILKNRNGATGDAVIMNYYPKFNLFDEQGLTQKPKSYENNTPSQQIGKRENERQKINAAIAECKDESGNALITDVCDRLDITTRQLKNRLNDLGIHNQIIKTGNFEYISEYEEINPREKTPFDID